jgi:hypothetical protein
VTVEHWFDRLSRPQTRRTTLKAAVAGGAALVLPSLRLPSAWATPTEPCLEPCKAAARAKWGASFDSCKSDAVKADAVKGSRRGGAPGTVLLILGGDGFLTVRQCRDIVELTFWRDFEKCKSSECGDPGKYPGGVPKKPPPKCTPVEEIVCGDFCCNALQVCCKCKSGKYTCCSDTDHCEPDPALALGNCCA